MNRIKFVFLIFWSVTVLAAASQKEKSEQNKSGEKQDRVEVERTIERGLNKKDTGRKDSEEAKVHLKKLKGKCEPKGCTYKGKFIPEGTKSYITPCEFCNCYLGEIACAVIDCAPIPSGCKAIPVKGQCCPKIECCGGCEYNGHFIPEGTTTQITPCEWCTCNGANVTCAIQDCARPPFGCKEIPIEGQCCPQYDCSEVGCEYDGYFIPEGETTYITPCIFCDCYEGQASCAIIDCAPIRTGCKAIPVEGQCCPKVECPEGCDYNGHFIPQGTTTQITPCEWCTCDGRNVTCAIQDCAQPPFGCKEIIIEGQCCRQYDCSELGCEYDGHFIAEGDTTYITPCEFCNCHEGQVYCTMIDCGPIPSECESVPVKGQCCPKIECCGGCEYNGHFIAEGNSTQITPCEWCSCNSQKVTCRVQDCAAPPVGCKQIPTEGQCCPRYDCGGLETSKN